MKGYPKPTRSNCNDWNQRICKDINQIYTDIYLTSTEDIRKCPNDKCTNAEFIILQPCHKPLKCEECGYEWRELVQMSKFQKFIKSTKESLTFTSETFSYLHEVLSGSLCPKCNLVIYKDGGCSHMVCSKCRFEFCWLCLGHYPGYIHSEMTFCPLRKSITVLMTLLFLSTIDFKLCQLFPFLGSIQYYIYFLILYLIFPNLFGMCAFIEIPLIAICCQCFKGWASPIEKCCRLPLIFCCIAYPFLYFYLCYKMWCSYKFCFIIKVILYEIVIVLSIIIGYFACICGAYKLIPFAIRSIFYLVKMITTAVISLVCCRIRNRRR